MQEEMNYYKKLALKLSIAIIIALGGIWALDIANKYIDTKAQLEYQKISNQINNTQ